MTASTELLLGTATAALTTADLAAVRSSLRAGLRHPHATGVDLEVRPDVLRDPARAAASGPFRWSPATVRRSLGLAALDACATGGFRTPAEAVVGVADEAVGAWRRTGWRQFHWEPWLASAGRGARGAVLAEATTWASLLWPVLDWRGLAEQRQVRFGGPARRVTFTGSPVVRLRARADVLVGPAVTRRERPGGGAPGGGGPARHDVPGAGESELGGSGTRGTGGRYSGPSAGDTGQGVAASTVVAVCGGTPAPTWRAELALLALVDLLAGPLRPAARRVVGLWPEACAARSLDIGPDELEVAAHAVTDVVGVVVGVAVVGGADVGEAAGGVAGPTTGDVARAGVASPPGDDDRAAA
jgi:hypothetical protein